MIRPLARLGLILMLIAALAACEDSAIDLGTPTAPMPDGDAEQEPDLDREADPEALDWDSDSDPDPEIEADSDPDPDPEPEPEIEIPPDPGFDQYGGSLKMEREATGFFRVEQIEGQWWLITPEGHPFFSTGVNVIGPHGTKNANGFHRYHDTIMEKYGSEQAWSDAQIPRLKEWGWNTLGGWSAWSLFSDRFPFTYFLSVSGANWMEGTAIDYFTEDYANHVTEAVTAGVQPVKDNPWLIGYFLDNELHWGQDHRGEHLFIEYMRFAADTPGKERLIQHLRDSYPDFQAFLQDFTTDAASWEELKSKTRLKMDENDESTQAVMAGWTGVVADKYFSLVDEVLGEVDPNHMNLGVRFISQLVPKAAIQAAGRYVDVMTINFYDLFKDPFDLAEIMQEFDPDYLSVENFLEQHYLAGGRPIMVTEWGFRANDVNEGLEGDDLRYNDYPPIYPILDTQKDRADAYEAKFRAMLERPWFVGQHWFLFADQPPEGRVNPADGEDNNFGLVSEQDEPYRELVERSAMMYEEIYKRLPWPAH